MGWRNPPISWHEFERRLSGREPSGHPDSWAPGDGSDAPAWSRKRQPYEVGSAAVETSLRSRDALPYAELHCRSNFSFSQGASDPEELVQEAVRLGLSALAITDRNGLYGIVRFVEAARAHGLATIFGAELTITSSAPSSAKFVDLCPQSGHKSTNFELVVLARGQNGYGHLARAISLAQLAGAKNEPRITLEELGEHAAAARHRDGRDPWVVLTGARNGAVPSALIEHGPAVARRELDRLIAAFGAGNVYVEIWDHGHPLDSTRNDALVRIAAAAGVDVVATNAVDYHHPNRHRLATALAAVAERVDLDSIDSALAAAGTAHLRSGVEQSWWFRRYPGAVERSVAIAAECAFDLALVAPGLPPFPCPDGHDEMSWLRQLTETAAIGRYGPRHDEVVPGAWRQIDHELATIEALGFPGYFLVVHDIVEFCTRSDIYCQGRGSAANSAVCYVLGITKADAVSLGLLFERFLSPERDGPPDIDIDIESGRREEVIQYVYDRYGRHHAAQVANVITYRARSAVRDMARALGYAPGQQDAFAKNLGRWSGLTSQSGHEGESVEDLGIPADVVGLAAELEDAPRHLGIHSGGMVICDRPIIEVCPVEWARMADRSVLQWDKDDCAAVGLVKFDLLGLGMLSALHIAVDLIADHHRVTVDLAAIQQEDEVYDMLCAADSIGVFQVESRAQMATLPRLKPRTFYDLVVEVALIRPGPIQGGSVHPYIRRRNGQEPVTYPHPLLEPALAKTLGIPLFQEQLMQMAIDVAGFSASEADQLRQAMGSKRSQTRMERLRERFYSGMAERGIEGRTADEIWDKLAAFANFGFPESHSVSFAYLVYASAWIKYHYPAAFCASLLNAQPMGFYSPHTLVQDARRHGVEVLRPAINTSTAEATLEMPEADASPRTRRAGGDPALRLGLGSVRSIGDDLAEAIVAERDRGGAFESIESLRRRTKIDRRSLEALATAGAFEQLGVDRREALWVAGAVASTGPDRLAGVVTGTDTPQLPGMSDRELAQADLWATGIAANGHPTYFLRDRLTAEGVVTAEGLASHPGTKVVIAGVVTHRQRPATAGGTTFLNIEDETGLINIVVSKGCWIRHRLIVGTEPALYVHGRLERNEGVVNVIAERFRPLPLASPKERLPSRDFR